MWHVEQNNEIESDPCRNLWAAVISEAVDCVRGTACGDNAHREIHQRNAIAWFKSDADGPGTLKWICEQIDLDVDEVRRIVSLRSFLNMH